MGYMELNNYKSGEKPERGDRVEAEPTKKGGTPRRGRVTGLHGALRGRTDVGGVSIDWEVEARGPGSPKRSTLDAAVLTKIPERGFVQNASNLDEDIAGIIHDLRYVSRSGEYDLNEGVRLSNGKVVSMRSLYTARRVAQRLVRGE